MTIHIQLRTSDIAAQSLTRIAEMCIHMRDFEIFTAGKIQVVFCIVTLCSVVHHVTTQKTSS